MPIAPQLVVGFHTYLSCLGWNCVQLDLVQVQCVMYNHCEFRCVHLPWAQKTWFSLMLSAVSDSYNFPIPSPTKISEPWGEECDTYVPFRAKHSIYSLLIFASLPVTASVLTTIHYKEKLAWWDLRGALVYGYRNNTWKAIWLLCPFNRIIVLGSPLELMARLPLVLGSFHGAGHGFHLLEQTLNPIRKCLVNSITLMLLLHPCA